MKKTNKKKVNKKAIFIRLLIVGVIVYAVCILIKQQQTLHSYAIEIKDLEEKIADAKEQKDDLTHTKENIDSREYIEKIAREKLDMYFPNERIYVNVGN